MSLGKGGDKGKVTLDPAVKKGERRNLEDSLVSTAFDTVCRGHRVDVRQTGVSSLTSFRRFPEQKINSRRIQKFVWRERK